MADSKLTLNFIEAPRLSLAEQQEIEQKIEIESVKFIHNLVRLGAFANILGGLFYITSIYNPAQKILIITWYTLLVAINLFNLAWGWRFERGPADYQGIMLCRKGYLYIVTAICLLWGSIGILFMKGADQQMTTIIFLFAVLICFSFSTAIDLYLGIVSILCLLIPTIIYHCFLALPYLVYLGKIPYQNTSLLTAFVVLGVFMLITCFLGNKIVIKLFRLGYENALLCRKMENINSLLEQRVQERTSELETSLKLVSYQATHDLLTELPNERMLYEKIIHATEDATQNHYKFAIICFSLNGMMKINDSIGHHAATTIINRISQRLSTLLQKNKKYFLSLSRQDVFIILVEQINNQAEIENLTQELFLILNNPVYVAKQSIKLTGSVGVSIFPENGRDVDTLITNAEAARALATRRGGNSFCIYHTVINAEAAKQLRIENLLYQAIENNELILNYQPFIDVSTGKVCGAEALVRWQNPTLGFVSPLDFIPLAEMNGMIIPIGEWVLKTACQQLKKWQNSGYKDFKISVNLSAKQLEHQNLIKNITRILHECKLEPQFLELELTESNAFQKEAIPIMNRLHEMGISLAIDDFGTGYSEFSSLKLFKINKIKIDKTFIQDIHASIDSRNIVSNTITLANRMNIECLAEGVETIEQLQFLKENNCKLMQGYYFSMPLNAKEFMAYLKKINKKKALT